MGRKKRTHIILVIVIALLLIGAIVLFAKKPRQAPLTQEILEEKDENLTKYLDFIADNVVGGGVNKDGIPAVDVPTYLDSVEAELHEGLRPEDTVFGIDYGGRVIAYPQKIMYWHEIANEKTLDGDAFSVTYCPLTGSVIGYLNHNLGVSGELYNSNLVMYDRETDTYYPQILGTGINGPDKALALDTFPVEVTTWEKWRAAHPDTKVLSRATGYARAYDDPPYQGYDTIWNIWFPVAAKSDTFHSKKIVHGIEHDGNAYTVLIENVEDPFTYDTGSGMLAISKDDELNTIQVTLDGNNVKHFDVYWFAWFAYHPDNVVIN